VKTGTYNGFVGSGALKTTGDTTVSAGALTVDADYSSDFALLCEGNLNASGTGTITCANAGTYGAKCPGTVTLPAGKIALGSADEYSPLIKVYHWISSAINGCYTTTPLSEEDFPTLCKGRVFLRLIHRSRSGGRRAGRHADLRHGRQRDLHGDADALYQYARSGQLYCRVVCK
jgi:hypothetical protein